MVFTPGPWKKVEECSNCIDIFGKNGNAVCQVMNADQTEVDEEIEANANLIIAAPKMLKALEAVMDYAEVHGDLEELIFLAGIRSVLKDARGDS